MVSVYFVSMFVSVCLWVQSNSSNEKRVILNDYFDLKYYFDFIND